MLSAKLLDSIPQSVRILRKFSTQSLGGHLTLQQFRVLKLVQEGHSQTQIAELLGVSMAAISKMVTLLVAHKLITRKAGPDKRTLLIKLTAKGKSTVEKVQKYVELKLDVGIEILSKEERIQLLAALLILDKLMQKMKEV